MLAGNLKFTLGSNMLIDILTDLAMEIGQVNTDSDRNARIYRINKAAKEIHRSTDLEEAMDEKIFDLNNENASQVALPGYVFEVRGARFVDGRMVISLDDMRNRYNFNFTGENEIWYLTFRDRARSCLHRTISNMSVITASIPEANGDAWTLTLTGRTELSNRISETLSFAATDLTKTGVLNFIELEAAVKNTITKFNTNLYDVESHLLGQVLNSEYQTFYKVFQIADTENFTQPANASGVEFWFKYKFQPFKLDTDTFLGTDKYDDAIIWKFLEHRAKTPEEAIMYQTKCKQILSQYFTDDQAGKRSKINFRPQPFFELPYARSGGFARRQ